MVIFQYIWPVALIVVSNVFYNVCTKSSPTKVSPFAALTVTYSVGAVVSLVLYFIVANKNADFVREMKNLNWAPFVLGIVIVGLEAGYLYAYKAGWQVSVLPVLQAAVVAVILLFVGFFFYKEGFNWKKIVGIVICLIGLVFLNLK